LYIIVLCNLGFRPPSEQGGASSWNWVTIEIERRKLESAKWAAESRLEEVTEELKNLTMSMDYGLRL